MIVNGNKNQIERGGDNVVESNFKIKATGKAFKILSDGLYSDKPLAIVRELCCNAYDAHVAAGKRDVPFTVHLPNWTEPYFSVKDDGVGLSKEQVEQIFTTYFESTKTDSNDYIGALGLGSKSPFSYVDSYTVISRYNGKKYSFNAFLNEDDIPCIALLFEEDTTECNGVEITMPVRSNDHSTFCERAARVFEWFNPVPNITGGRVNIQTRKYAMEGTGWKLESLGYGGWGYNSRTATAVQGLIGYPLKIDAITEQLTSAERIILSNPFVIDFPIGELEVAASREYLSYKRGTIENIKKAAQRIIGELPSRFQSTIDACKTKWEAVATVIELTNSHSVVRELATNGHLKITYKGEDLPTNHLSIKTSEYKGLTVTRHNGYRPDVASMENYHYQTYSITPDKRIEFYIDDLKRGASSRARHYSKTASVSAVYLLKADDQALIERFLEAMGDPTVKKASELPTPPKDGSAGRVSKTSIQQLKRANWNNSWGFETIDEDLDVEDGGIWIGLYRSCPIKGEPSESASKIHSFSEIIESARKLGIITDADEIYGVTVNAIKKIKGHEDWQNLEDVLNERFKKYLDKGSLTNDLALKQSLAEWRPNNYWTAYWLPLLENSSLAKDHPLRRFQEERVKAQAINTDTAQHLAGLLGFQASTQGGTASYNFSSEWTKIITKYPLITMDLKVDDQGEMEHFAHYVKLIDSEKR